MLWRAFIQAWRVSAYLINWRIIYAVYYCKPNVKADTFVTAKLNQKSASNLFTSRPR